MGIMVGPEDVRKLLILLGFSWAKIRSLPISTVWFRGYQVRAETMEMEALPTMEPKRTPFG
jgi:hypothetical protein